MSLYNHREKNPNPLPERERDERASFFFFSLFFFFPVGEQVEEITIEPLSCLDSFAIESG
ncbi:hypothetical protein CCACVL1_29692 [Corchorus capsularis]|uniref:Uncharacterized protein n=1 Tax=Corchorus capsularis TaxID=210143 RepID=A0A1R3G0G3_COCAP|nr:hypothetical protein CCACVL1_29692 [Corchorus capsularis]